eukprot:360672-Alexandrium_andersonii.AAC.1
MHRHPRFVPGDITPNASTLQCLQKVPLLGRPLLREGAGCAEADVPREHKRCSGGGHTRQHRAV